jgi:hypothetical protein
MGLAVQAFQSYHHCASIPFAKRIEADNQGAAIPNSELLGYQSWRSGTMALVQQQCTYAILFRSG